MDKRAGPGTAGYVMDKLDFYKAIVRHEIGFERMKRAEREWAELFGGREVVRIEASDYRRREQ